MVGVEMSEHVRSRTNSNEHRAVRDRSSSNERCSNPKCSKTDRTDVQARTEVLSEDLRRYSSIISVKGWALLYAVWAAPVLTAHLWRRSSQPGPGDVHPCPTRRRDYLANFSRKGKTLASRQRENTICTDMSRRGVLSSMTIDHRHEGCTFANLCR